MCNLAFNVSAGFIFASLTLFSLSHTDSAPAAQRLVAWGVNCPDNGPQNLTDVVGIAVGGAHVVAVQREGTVVCWGDNSSGQTNVPAGLADVIAVAAGAHHSLALKRDGAVVAWGSNRAGQTRIPPNLSNVVAIAAANHYNLALRSDGTVLSWGSAAFDEWELIPYLVPALSNTIAIAAGCVHALALQSDGTVIAWDAMGTQAPIGLREIAAIDAGCGHSLALKDDGTVLAFGNYGSGQTDVPAGLEGVVAIAAGADHNLALLADGQVIAWGSSENEATAVPPGLTNIVAMDASGWMNVVASGEAAPFIQAGPYTQTAVSGTAVRFQVQAIGSGPLSYQWEYNGVGLPGATNRLFIISNVQPAVAGSYRVVVSNAGSTATSANAGLTVIHRPPVITVAPSNRVSFPGGTAAFQVGAVGSLPMSYQWFQAGAMLSGETNAELSLRELRCEQAGEYSVRIQNAFGAAEAAVSLSIAPVVVWDNVFGEPADVPPTLTNVAAISAGDGHMLALQRDGTVLAWGQDDHGQATVPLELEAVSAIAAGGAHSLALKMDGTLVAWGIYRFQTDTFVSTISAASQVPADLNSVAAIAAGANHSLALRSDGMVVSWGGQTWGHFMAQIPDDLSNVVAIAAGDYHNLALRSDGSIVAWGAAGSPTNVPPGLSNVVAIAAGATHNLALRADGTVVAWGSNYDGLLLVPSGLSGVVAVSAGGGFGMALRTNGTVVVWAAHNSVQRPLPTGLSNVVAIAAGPQYSAAIVGDAAPGAPGITAWPQSLTRHARSPILLTAPAIGAQPMVYQWQRNGTNMPGGSHSWLQLTSLQMADSGEYSVVVSNGFGSATFTVTRLTVLPVWLVSLRDGREVDRELTQAIGPMMAVAAGPGYDVGLNFEGTVTAWGCCFDLTNPPPDLTNVVAVAAGEGFSLALHEDGTVRRWGFNEGNPLDDFTNVVAIAAHSQHALALRDDGTVAAMGYYQPGGDCVTGISSLTNVIAIAAGENHDLALLGDGTVVAHGQATNLPPGLSDVIAVAAGGHSVALRSDGTLAAWNSEGESLPVPAALSNVTAITAGHGHNLALKADGTLTAWGHYESGLSAFPAFLPLQLDHVTSISSMGSHDVIGFGAGRPVLLPRGPNRRVYAGERVVMVSGARGLGPLSYQWQHDSVDLPGATNAFLVLSNAQATHEGNYRVWVSNAYGTVAGAGAALVVEDGPPRFMRPLLDQRLYSGNLLRLRADILGTAPQTFQWLKNGLVLPGATESELVMTSAQMEHAGGYSVSVSNVFGVVTSTVAQLTILESQPIILDQPSSIETYPGANVALCVTLAGSQPMTLQWRLNGVDLPGEEHSTLLLKDVHPYQAGDYSVMVSNAFGTVITSNAALVLTAIVAWGDPSVSHTNVISGLTEVIAVAAGTTHSLALRRDGTVVAWGSAEQQPSVPPDLNRVVAVSAGNGFSLALRKDGTVVGWGIDNDGQASPPAGLPPVRALAAGGAHSLALLQNETVVAWGQSGTWHPAEDPEAPPWYEPDNRTNVPPDLTNVIAIAAGGGHSLALKRDGTVVAWGVNSEDQATVPAGLSNIVAIAAGSGHNLALAADGTVRAWGRNGYSGPQRQCILDEWGWICWDEWVYTPTGQTNVPVGLTNVVAIAAGASHSLALLANGTVVSWGTVCGGEAAAGLADVWAIAAGGGQCLAIRGAAVPTLTEQPADVRAYVGERQTLHARACGPSLAYQWLLNGHPLSGATQPECVLENIQLTGAGDYRLIVSNAWGTVTSSVARVSVLPSPFVGWGFNDFGQASVPDELSNTVAIAAGFGFSLALAGDGTIRAWGYGAMIPPADLSNVVAIAAGGQHALALKRDRTVAGWGGNPSIPGSIPVEATNVVAIAAGGFHNLALRADGSVIAWGASMVNAPPGLPVAGQAIVPPGLSHVVAIAAGTYHSLALKSDGTVVGWGSNTNFISGGIADQATVPPGLADVVAIAAGGVHNLALRGDGTVVAWGANTHGQAEVPEGLTDVVDIDAGVLGSLALRRDGSLVGWGIHYWAGNRAASSPPANLPRVTSITCGGDHSLALLEAVPHEFYRPVLEPQLSDGTFQISLSTEMGRSYQLEWTASPADPHWFMLPPTPGHDSVQTLSDPQPVSTRRFYRIRWR